MHGFAPCGQEGETCLRWPECSTTRARGGRAASECEWGMPMDQFPRFGAKTTLAGVRCCLLCMLAPLVGQAATGDHSLAQGKKLLYVMNYREVDLAKKEDPPRPELVKMKQEVLDEDWKVVAHLKSLGFV